jgi:anion-transporting  ArsA/GET3 family ATPase
MSESRLPTEYRDAKASQLAKIVGRALPNVVSQYISPDKIEHLGHGYLTEAWGLAAAISDAYLHTEGVAPPKKALGEMPMFKGVLTAPEKDRAVGEFYEITKKTGQIRNALRSAQKEGDKETVARIKTDPENIKLSKAAPMLQKESAHISKAQQRIKRIKNDPDLSGEEKTKLIRVQQHRINTIAERGLKKGERKGIER